MNLKQAASAAMAAVMTMSATVPTVLAAEEASSPAVNAGQGSSEDAPSGPSAKAYTKEQNHQSTKVYAAVNGMYVLTVPESINLHNTDKSDIGSGLYVNDKHCKVNLKGDIGYEKVVSVTVTNPVMQSEGASDKTATVDTTTKTVWNRNDLLAGATEDASGEFSDPVGTSVVYPVSAELTPGDWVGTATFNCTMGEAPTIASLITGIQPTSFDYDGQEHSPELIFASGANLVEGRDYTISGDTAKTDDGKYTIHINASGEYAGSVSYDWEIKRYDINDAVSGLDKNLFQNDGSVKKPEIQWKDTTLKEGEDYIITGTTSSSEDGSYTITITGTGKYKGEITLPWKIVSQTDIALAVKGLNPESFDYDSQKHTPGIVWKEGFEGLVEGKDYEISGDIDKSEEGKYTLTITGKGDYRDSVTLNWEIKRYDISGAVSGLDKDRFENDGSTKTPNIQWNEGFESLVKDKDYTITGTPSASGDGNYTITITGIGKYKGEITLDWKIVTPVDINLAIKGIEPESYDYDGQTHTPNILWNPGYEGLTKDKDYAVTGDLDKSEEGKYQLTITGKDNYKGQISYNWEIKRYDITGAVKGLDKDLFENDGSAKRPNILWNEGYENLERGKDYEISGIEGASGNGDFSITITGIGKYKGEITLPWKIVTRVDIALAVQGITPTSYDFDTMKHAPGIIWKPGYENLVKDVDYQLAGNYDEYEGGQYTMTIVGIGKYKGSASFPWEIKKYDISVAVKGLDQDLFENDGTTHKPNIVWNDGYKGLIEGIDYEIKGTQSASGDGSYTITVQGLGKYENSIDLPWKIITRSEIALAAKGLTPEFYDYDGKFHTPGIVWNTGFENLKENVDYTISGDMNKTEEGVYTLTVTGIGYYKGTVSFQWEIKKYDIAIAVKGLSKTRYKSNALIHRPDVTWNDGYNLTKGTDYKISGTTYALAAGNYKITVTGMGKYKGSVDLPWAIVKAQNISTAIASISPEFFEYDGQEHSPKITWNSGYENLAQGEDYDISGDIIKSACGEYTMTITGKDVFKGSMTFKWRIREIIPENAVYTISSSSKKLVGDGKTVYFPLSANSGDTYMDEDYTYTCSASEWGSVKINDKTKTAYGAIRPFICDKNITSLDYTFENCANMVAAPVIPANVTSMNSTFSGCNSLKSYAGSKDPDGDFTNYKIPNGVSKMALCFSGCKKTCRRTSTSRKNDCKCPILLLQIFAILCRQHRS